MRYALDHSKITNALGWELTIPLKKGLKKRIASHEPGL